VLLACLCGLGCRAEHAAKKAGVLGRLAQARAVFAAMSE
jgi:hypothetical protein